MGVDRPVVVLSYGCPRSGTSVVAKMCENLTGVAHQKWKEISDLHPGRCSTGMLQIGTVFTECRLVFVRSVREPIDVVHSFYALRTPAVQSTGTIKHTGDEKILEWIERESENTASQRRRMRKELPWRKYDIHMVEAKYEVLGSEDDRHGFTRDFSNILPHPEENRQRLEKFLSEYWGSPAGSVRAGQLAAGVEVMIREEKEIWWREQLRDVAEREGYSA